MEDVAQLIAKYTADLNSDVTIIYDSKRQGHFFSYTFKRKCILRKWDCLMKSTCPICRKDWFYNFIFVQTPIPKTAPEPVSAPNIELPVFISDTDTDIDTGSNHITQSDLIEGGIDRITFFWYRIPS